LLASSKRLPSCPQSAAQRDLRAGAGSAWDAFTIGPYRSWKHLAERDDIPPERSAAAARAAGFDGDDRIGPYLRSLIQSHHDTLATPVR
jgi:hypothetical protein